MSKTRNYGIDLLRLVLMFMVCTLHIMGRGGVISTSVEGTIEHKVYWFIKMASYGAVDGFALISGYMANNKPRRYEKLVEMWFQAFFYGFIMTLVFVFFGLNKSFEWPEIFHMAFPVSYGNFWYFTAFFLLFFAMPILNKYLFSLDLKASKKALIIFVLLFSIMGVYNDPFKSHDGYSVTWLLALYCIGLLARRTNLFRRLRPWVLVTIWAGSLLLTWALRIYWQIDILVSYLSPTVLLSAIVMVVFFSKLKVKGKHIAKLSPLAFGVYLFHLNPILWDDVIYDGFTFIPEMELAKGVGVVFLVATGIFVTGLTIEYFRVKLAKLFKIPELSLKITQLINAFLDKLATL